MTFDEKLAKGIIGALLGIGCLVNLLILSTALERLLGPRTHLRSFRTHHGDVFEEPFRRPSLHNIRLTLYIVLLGLLLSYIRLALDIASIALFTFSTSDLFYNAIIMREGFSLQITALRLFYATWLANMLTKVCFMTALVTGNRLLLLPSTKVSKTKARLSLVANIVQTLVSLALALAAWSMTLIWGLYYDLSIDPEQPIPPVPKFNPGTPVDEAHQDNTKYEASGSSSTPAKDKGELKIATYIQVAFVSWFFFSAVWLVAILLRKIAHSRKQGLDSLVEEADRRTLVTFSKWVIPWLLIAAALFVADIFMSIFSEDLQWGGKLAHQVLSVLSSLLGDWVGFGMTLWAAGQIMKVSKTRIRSEEGK